MNGQSNQRMIFVVCFAVVSVAVVGYFVGMQSPMNPPGGKRIDANAGSSTDPLAEQPAHSSVDTTGDPQANGLSNPSDYTVVAAGYSEMGDITKAKAAAWKTTLAELGRNPIWSLDPLAEVKISENDKSSALAKREFNRAFNGAPPTVPHPTTNMTAETCAACHTQGAKTESFRISAMSHPFLSSCTQCHIENAPEQFQEFVATEGEGRLSNANSFVGLPAPTAGPRAFAGAPPQIPHSTWMRDNCMSCHGYTGLQGIRTTHPWQQNCQQCHANASKLNQVMSGVQPSFLPPPKLTK